MILIFSKARHAKCINHHQSSSRSNGMLLSSNTSSCGCHSSSPTDQDLFDLSSMNNTLRSCYFFKPIDPPTCGTSSIINTATSSIETTAGTATFSPTSSSRIENRQDKEEEEQSSLQQQNFVPISPHPAPCSAPPARQTNKRVLPNQDEKVDDGFYHPHCYHPCTPPPRGPSPSSRTRHHYGSTPLLDRCRRQHRRQDAYCWSPPPPPNPTRKRRRMMIGTTTGTSAIYSTSTTTTTKENLLFPFILNDEDEDEETNLFKDCKNPSSCNNRIVNMKNTETTRTAARKKITIDRKWKLMPRKRTFVEEPIAFSSCDTLPINEASKILD